MDFSFTKYSKNITNQLTSLPLFVRWCLMLLLISVCIGTASALFLHSLQWVTAVRDTHRYLIYFLPIAGWLIGYFYKKYGQSVVQGVDLVLVNVKKPHYARIPWQMAPFVYGATLFTHLFGGSAGREGTALQIAGSISDQFTKIFGFSNDDRKLLMYAALAGGFGSVFGTPFAGAVFGIEVCRTKITSIKSIYIPFISAMLSHAVANMWRAPHSTYEVAYIPALDITALLYILLAAICFGLCSRLFCIAQDTLHHFFKKQIPSLPWKAFVGGLAVLCIVWLSQGYDFMGLGLPLIAQSFTEPSLGYYFLLKLLLTTITLSSGFKGGEVTPLFFIGATLGSFLSGWIDLPTALMASMGFVAVFAGCTKTPIACSIMAWELFGWKVVLFTTLACILAYFVSGKHTIYKAQREV